MKFDHTVKFNGKYYLPGEEVPIDQPVIKEEPKVEEPEVAAPVEQEVVVEEPKTEEVKRKGGRPKKKA